MKKAVLFTVLVLGLRGLLSVLSAQPTLVTTQPLSKVPLAFTKNMGQWDEQVQYRTSSGGATIWICKDKVVYQFLRTVKDSSRMVGPSGLPDDPMDRFAEERDSVEQLVITAKFVGANPNVEIIGEDLMDYKCHYFLGNEPAKWHSNVPNYGAITLKNLYPGIDLKYFGNRNGQAAYEFITATEADLAQIKVDYEGVDETAIDSEDKVTVRTKWGEMIAAIQPSTGGKVSGISSLSLLWEKTPSFEANGTSQQALGTLAVTLSYSTFLGGSGSDKGRDIAVDGAGSAYVTGETFSSDFPTASAFDGSWNGGATDVFVTKLSPTGNSLVYSTYLGGGGSGSDKGRDIAVDGAGSAYVTGETFSSDFPTVGPFDGSWSGGAADAFVTKLSPTGNSLVYSTYLGGTNHEDGTAIAVDLAGSAYVTGYTYSSDFPTASPFDGSLSGITDVFVTKLSPVGNSLVYSTYLGGTHGDAGGRIAVDLAGSVYVAGGTSSPDFPTVGPFDGSWNGGAADVFVTKLSPTGNSLVYSTYLGGTNDDTGGGIAVDLAGSAYVTGNTTSPDFPTIGPFDGSWNGGAADAFVTKLSPTGNSLVYSTYLGGTNEDVVGGIAVDLAGSAYVMGSTLSSDFPMASPFDSSWSAGNYDAFVTKLSPVGNSLVYSTYLGGGGFDDGPAIAVDLAGCAFVTGSTYSSDFPLVNAYQVTRQGFDAFVAKLSPLATNSPPIATINSVTPNPASLAIPVSFSGQGSDIDGSIVAFSWRSDIDGQLSNQASFNTSSLSLGNHTIYFKVQDNDGDWSAEVSVGLVIQSSLCAGNALQFDGIDDEVFVPHNTSLSFNSSHTMTIECWFKLSSGQDTYHIVGKRTGCGDLNYQIAGSAGQLHFLSPGASLIHATYVPPVGQWVHVAGVYDGTSPHLFVNGVEVGVLDGATTLTNSSTLTFGGAGTCERLHGEIDEVRLWNVARTTEQINANMHQSIPCNSAGLVGYWNFDEAIGSQQVLDCSSAGNNGTLGDSLSVGSDDPKRVVSTAPMLGNCSDSAPLVEAIQRLDNAVADYLHYNTILAHDVNTRAYAELIKIENVDAFTFWSKMTEISMKSASLQVMKDEFLALAKQPQGGAGSLVSFAAKIGAELALMKFNKTSYILRESLLNEIELNLADFEQNVHLDDQGLSVNAAIASLTSPSIPATLPISFPRERVINAIDHVVADLVSVTFNNPPSVNGRSEKTGLYYLPGYCDVATSQNYLVGFDVQQAMRYYIALDRLMDAEQWDAVQQRFCGSTAGTLAFSGKVVTLIVSAALVTTGGLGVPTYAVTEYIYNSYQVLCASSEVAATAAKYYRTTKMGCSLSEFNSSWPEAMKSVLDLRNKMVNDIVDAVTVPAAADCSANVKIISTQVPQTLCSPMNSPEAEFEATITLQNLDDVRSAPVKFFVELYSQGENFELNHIRTDSLPSSAIDPGESRNFTIPLRVAARGFLLANNFYKVIFRVVTRDGLIVRSRNIQSMYQHQCDIQDFFDYSEEAMSGFITESARTSKSFVSSAGAKFNEFTLWWPGSDLNLHAYDTFGRHVGYNDSTQSVDLQIPGATYSGPQSYPEVIRIPNPIDSFQLQVEAVSVVDSEYFSLEVQEIFNHVPVVVPTVSPITLAGNPGDSISYSFQVKEAGGQSSATSVTAVVSNLISISGDTIIASPLVGMPETLSPSGIGTASGHFQVGNIVSENEFTGVIQVSFAGGSFDVPVSLFVVVPDYCGDADGSSVVNISDVVFLINYIFGGGPAPISISSGDADCSGMVTISDAVYLINYIFSGGIAPCAACP